jgi:hypothetical protein
LERDKERIMLSGNLARNDTNRERHMALAQAFARDPRLTPRDMVVQFYVELGEPLPTNEKVGNFRRMTDQLRNVADAARHDLKKTVEVWPPRGNGPTLMNVSEYYFACRLIASGCKWTADEIRRHSQGKK